MSEIIAGLIVAIIVLIFIIPVLQEWKHKKMTIEAVRKEDERIANLPKLNTRYLMKIPASGRGSIKEKPRTFGTRYNRLIVFDENGDGWLGLFMPSTFESLHNSEYIQENYWVPFRGDGERNAGAPVIIDGQKIDIYPVWMNAMLTSNSDWKIWADLYKSFYEAHAFSSYNEAFRKFTPHERTHELAKQRQKFEAMRSSITTRKKTSTIR